MMTRSAAVARRAGNEIGGVVHRNARWSPERFRTALADAGYSLRQFGPAYNTFGERYAVERDPPLPPTFLTVSHGTLRRWAKGLSAPTVWQLEALALFLQRHTEWF